MCQNNPYRNPQSMYPYSRYRRNIYKRHSNRHHMHDYSYLCMCDHTQNNIEALVWLLRFEGIHPR